MQGYWIQCGSENLPDEGGPSMEGFILTATVRAHMRAVARALTMQQQCPILLQGPTSSGKTTLVEYIARTTGHKTVRINNHQHTDLQVWRSEYNVVQSILACRLSGQPCSVCSFRMHYHTQNDCYAGVLGSLLCR